MTRILNSALRRDSYVSDGGASRGRTQMDYWSLPMNMVGASIKLMT